MTTKQGWDWEGEFDEEFTKGDDWIAPNMKASYIKSFIHSALSHQRKEIREKVEGMRIELTEAQTLEDHWGLTEGGVARIINNNMAAGRNKCIADILELLK